MSLQPSNEPRFAEPTTIGSVVVWQPTYGQWLFKRADDMSGQWLPMTRNVRELAIAYMQVTESLAKGNAKWNGIRSTKASPPRK